MERFLSTWLRLKKKADIILYAGDSVSASASAAPSHLGRIETVCGNSDCSESQETSAEESCAGSGGDQDRPGTNGLPWTRSGGVSASSLVLPEVDGGGAGRHHPSGPPLLQLFQVRRQSGPEQLLALRYLVWVTSGYGFSIPETRLAMSLALWAIDIDPVIAVVSLGFLVGCGFKPTHTKQRGTQLLVRPIWAFIGPLGINAFDAIRQQSPLFFLSWQGRARPD